MPITISSWISYESTLICRRLLQRLRKRGGRLLSRHIKTSCRHSRMRIRRSIEAKTHRSRRSGTRSCVRPPSSLRFETIPLGLNPSSCANLQVGKGAVEGISDCRFLIADCRLGVGLLSYLARFLLQQGYKSILSRNRQSKIGNRKCLRLPPSQPANLRSLKGHLNVECVWILLLATIMNMKRSGVADLPLHGGHV